MHGEPSMARTNSANDRKRTQATYTLLLDHAVGSDKRSSPGPRAKAVIVYEHSVKEAVAFLVEVLQQWASDAASPLLRNEKIVRDIYCATTTGMAHSCVLQRLDRVFKTGARSQRGYIEGRGEG